MNRWIIAPVLATVLAAMTVAAQTAPPPKDAFITLDV
jgi:hypothetical protein